MIAHSQKLCKYRCKTAGLREKAVTSMKEKKSSLHLGVLTALFGAHDFCCDGLYSPHPNPRDGRIYPPRRRIRLSRGERASRAVRCSGGRHRRGAFRRADRQRRLCASHTSHQVGNGAVLLLRRAKKF